MGFVGGGSNIAITTALPPSSSVHCIVNIKLFMDFLYLIFYGCLRLRFLDVETNPGPRRPVPAVCRILCSGVRGLAGNLSDLTLASSQYDILLCSVVFCPVVLCRGKMPRARGMAAYVRDGYGAFRQPKFECGCCEMLVFRVYGMR